MIAHGFGTSSKSVTLPILFKDGTPVQSVQDYKKKNSYSKAEDVFFSNKIQK